MLIIRALINADALDTKCKHFGRFLDVRALAPHSPFADIIGIFFEAHVLEKYVKFIIKTLRVLNGRFAFDAKRKRLKVK